MENDQSKIIIINPWELKLWSLIYQSPTIIVLSFTQVNSFITLQRYILWTQDDGLINCNYILIYLYYIVVISHFPRSLETRERGY